MKVKEEIDHLAYLGKYLKVVRKELGFKQSDVCKSMKISQTHLSQIENGVRTGTIQMLDRIMAFYNITITITYYVDKHTSK